MCVSTSLYEVVTGKMSQYVFCHVNPISVFALFNFNFFVETCWKQICYVFSEYIFNLKVEGKYRNRNDTDLDYCVP